MYFIQRFIIQYIDVFMQMYILCLCIYLHQEVVFLCLYRKQDKIIVRSMKCSELDKNQQFFLGGGGCSGCSNFIFFTYS